MNAERTKGAVTVVGEWSETQVAGHPLEVYRPAEANLHGYVLIYLHGVHLGKLHDKRPFLEAFERFGLPVVCPVTQRSWWTNRICAEFSTEITAMQHVMRNVLPWIEQEFAAAPPKLGLFGTSMGGQGALRLSYLHPEVFPVVAAISPAIDYHKRMREGDETLFEMYPDEEAARQDTAILHVHPLNWPRQQFFCCDPTDHDWFDSSDRLHMKLSSIGIPHTYDLETSAGGHGFEYYGKMAERVIEFLWNGLEAERRRLPLAPRRE